MRFCDEYCDVFVLFECLILFWEGIEDMYGRYDDVVECIVVVGIFFVFVLVDDVFYCFCFNMVGIYSFVYC